MDDVLDLLRVNWEPVAQDGRRSISAGIDLVEIGRITDSIEKHGDRFLNRIFTATEQTQSAGRHQSLAGRFAVKEAVAKVLGTGIGTVAWTEIEVQNDERGQPHLTLYGNAHQLAADLGLNVWSISITHTEHYAAAIAVATDE